MDDATAKTPLVLRINTFVRLHFVHLISLVSLIAYLVPGVSSAVRTHRTCHGQLDASGIALFMMMLSAAIQCGLGALRSVFTRPRSLVVCLVQFFVILPVSCWILGHLCVPLLGRQLGEPIQLGLYLVILMPVAATSAIWVRDAKGDIELLVGLVVITMSVGTLTAPLYLSAMSGLTASAIVIPRLFILRQLVVGVLLPLVTGIALNSILRKNLQKVQPYFALMGSSGLFLAVFLNVGTASPLLHQLSFRQIGLAMMIVLAVNLANFFIGSLVGRLAKLTPEQQVTCELGSGMRSNGTALVVGLASFPATPLITVPAAIYIIFQHLIASVVKTRLTARYATKVIEVATVSIAELDTAPIAVSIEARPRRRTLTPAPLIADEQPRARTRTLTPAPV